LTILYAMTTALHFTRAPNVPVIVVSGEITAHHVRDEGDAQFTKPVDVGAESDASRTLIPIHRGQQSGDRGQLVRTG
jgi:hypothetical protein